MSQYPNLDDLPEFLTVKQFCELLQISYDSGLGLVKSGAVQSFDITATKTGERRKPVYRISKEAVAELLAGREVQPPAPPGGKKRRTKPTDVIPFF